MRMAPPPTVVQTPKNVKSAAVEAVFDENGGPTIPTPRSARRRLFDSRPREEVDQWLDDQLKASEKVLEEKSRKYNFDFKTGQPLNSPDAEYDVEPVDAAQLPAFYHTRIHTRGSGKKRPDPPEYTPSPVHSPSRPSTSSSGKGRGDTAAKKIVHPPLLRPTVVTRAAEKRLRDAKANLQQQSTTPPMPPAAIKQTKITQYMPARKRRSTASRNARGTNGGRTGGGGKGDNADVTRSPQKKHPRKDTSSERSKEKSKCDVASPMQTRGRSRSKSTPTAPRPRRAATIRH